MIVTEKLKVWEKVKFIRNTLGLSRDKVAELSGLSHTTINNYETGAYPIDKSLPRIKKAMGIEDIPLTDDEIVAYKKNMYSANISINYSDIKAVNETICKLARCAKLSFDGDLQNLCDLFQAIYTFKIGEKEEHDKLMESLLNRKHTFTNEHFYWYYRCLGFVEHLAYNYKDAYSMYRKADEHGRNLGLDFQLNFKTLHYNMCYCSTEMDYPILPIKHLDKVRSKDFSLLRLDSEIAAKRFLAISYSKLGRTDEALEILEDCLGYALREKKYDRLQIGWTYLQIGRVYQDAGDFDKALENFDKAVKYYDHDSEAYLAYLCYRATLLRSHNCDNKVKECLDKGLLIATKGTLWYEWLMAIKHSTTLDDKASIKTLEGTYIPSLLRYGKHMLVKNLYEWLSNHYQQSNMYKSALEYTTRAKKIYEQLMRGDLSL